ncbi:MAG: hypothetical protein ABUL43_02715, partial [Hyphomicrobium sp.]
MAEGRMRGLVWVVAAVSTGATAISASIFVRFENDQRRRRFRRDYPHLDETGFGTHFSATTFTSSRRLGALPSPHTAQRETIMDQKFVYHSLNRTNAPRARVASAKLVVSEYLAYVTMLSAAVVIAIFTFAYAANVTVHWL